MGEHLSKQPYTRRDLGGETLHWQQSPQASNRDLYLYHPLPSSVQQGSVLAPSSSLKRPTGICTCTILLPQASHRDLYLHHPLPSSVPQGTGLAPSSSHKRPTGICSGTILFPQASHMHPSSSFAT